MEICIPAKSMGYGVTKKHIHKKQNPYQKKKHKTMGFCACRVSKKTPPCRQSLISWGPLTIRQKYKAVGSSTLLRKVSFAAPVFFGVQNIHLLKSIETPAFPLGIPFGKLFVSQTLPRSEKCIISLEILFSTPAFFGILMPEKRKERKPWFTILIPFRI